MNTMRPRRSHTVTAALAGACLALGLTAAAATASTTAPAAVVGMQHPQVTNNPNSRP